MNSALLSGRRTEAIAKIDAHIATLNKDLATTKGDATLRAACLEPLKSLRGQAQEQDSLAHITQAENEAVKEFDAAVGGIENFLAEQKKPKATDSEEFMPPLASESNKFMVDVKRPGMEVAKAMADEKVFIGRVWPSWPTHVRVSIGTKEEMEKFKTAFSKVMA